MFTITSIAMAVKGWGIYDILEMLAMAEAVELGMKREFGCIAAPI